MQNELHEPVANWPTSSRAKAELSKTHEGWYNMPGTSPHELNMNVTLPKGRLSASQKLSTKQGVFLGIGVVALVSILFLLYHKMRNQRGY